MDEGKRRVHMPNLKPEAEAFCVSHKRPLSRREYEAMKYSIACVNATLYMLEALKPRIRECMPKGFWRDANLVASIQKKLMDGILLTIPAEKLKIMQSEIQRYELYVRTAGAAGYDNDEGDNVVIPRQTLKDLANFAGETNCSMCMKTGKAARKCKLRKILADTFPYNPPQVVGESEECIFTGYSFERSGAWEGLEELTDDEIVGSEE